MNKYIYLGTFGNRFLFYNETKDEFYSSEDEILNEEKAVLITNPNEIKALKIAYESIKNYEKKEKDLNKAIKSLNKKDREEKLANNRRKNIFIFYSFITLTLIAFHSEIQTLASHLSETLEEVVDAYHMSNQNDEEHFNSFKSSIDANSTMSEDLKEIFKNIFANLVESDAFIRNHQVKDMCHRFKNFNFENYDESNYLNALPYIIFGENNGFNKLVSKSLAESASDLEPSEESLMLGLLNILGDGESLTQIFIGGKDNYIEDLAKTYNVSESEINDLLNLIISYSESKDGNFRDETKKAYYQKLGSILLDYYHNKGDYSSIDYLVLSSQVFDGNFNINNNIFTNLVVINVDDPTYGKYSLYYDAKTGEDISYLVYYEKLVELINNKGNNLDYDDPDSRFLIYLMYLTYTDSWDFEYYEFEDINTSEDLAKKFINNIFYGSYGRVSVNPAFLYAYLSNGKINIPDIIGEVKNLETNAFSVALFKELDSCIRIDLNKSNMSYDDYNEVLVKKLDNLKENDENLYNLLMNSIVDDTSFFTEFKLSPFTYTLSSGDIKKYIYEPEE